MTAQNFMQLHLLTFYPPSNPNRDDSSRPKTAQVGGVERLRLSSQAIKRAVRTSDAFQAALDGHLGKRTQRVGDEVLKRLKARGMADKAALEHARKVAAVFGKVKGEADAKAYLTEQLAFVSPTEMEAALAFADTIPEGAPAAEIKPEQILRRSDHAVDVALFGRMFADATAFNREAAAQVAHSFTTHRVALDDDFYTAVDDLKDPGEEDAGAGFIGDLAFGSGVHYLYACVDRDLLLKNLGRDAEGSAELASAGIKALIEGFATTSPGGKRKAFAHNPRASYVLAERGDQQPRSLAIAFLKPVRDDDLMAKSIERLEETCIALDRGYGPNADARRVLNVYPSGPGREIAGAERVATLGELAAFCAAP